MRTVSTKVLWIAVLSLVVCCCIQFYVIGKQYSRLHAVSKYNHTDCYSHAIDRLTTQVSAMHAEKCPTQ